MVFSPRRGCSKYRSVYMVGLIMRNGKCQRDCLARTPLSSPLLAVIWRNAGSEWIIVDCVLVVSADVLYTKEELLMLLSQMGFYLFVTESIDNKLLIFRRPGRRRGISPPVDFD